MMSAAKKLLAAAAVLGAVVALALPVNASASSPVRVDVAGTIRWASPTSWIVLDDAGHAPVGLAYVDVLPDRLRVHYTFTADKINVVHVTPDEAFSAAGVRCGVSVGLSYADVFCYMAGSSTPVDPALLTKAGGNLWISGTFELGEV